MIRREEKKSSRKKDADLEVEENKFGLNPQELRAQRLVIAVEAASSEAGLGWAC